MDDFQQLVLIEALVANWDTIRLRMGDLPPALAAEFTALGLKLAQSQSPDERLRALLKLLALTRKTPAADYVRALVAGAILKDESRTREFGLRLEAPTAEVITPPVTPAVNSLVDLLNGASLPLGVTQIPVFFATNRQPENSSSTNFLGQIAASLTYGYVWVTIPAAHKQGHVERPGWWNLLANPQDVTRYFTCSGERLGLTQFQTQLAAATRLVQVPQLLIFLHGYSVPFEDAAMRAAQFAQDSNFDGLVVLFSWPSRGGLGGYTADEASAGASGDPMAAWLKDLTDGPWQQIHLLAHSMGGRVLLSALADNPRPKLPIRQVVFAAPDVYVPDFQNKLQKLRQQGPVSATLYSSRTDRALQLSRLIHRGGPRVGLIEDIPVVSDSLESIDATKVASGMLAHSYWGDQRALITDIRALLLKSSMAHDRGLSRIGPYYAFP